MGEIPIARPTIPESLVWVWNAFNDLAGDRPFTLAGAGPIPWSVRQRYAEHLGLDEDEAGEFHALIRALDSTWLELSAHPKPGANGDGG